MLDKFLVSIYDKSIRKYHILDYPIHDRDTLQGIVRGKTLDELNNRFTLIIDGCPVDWPHIDAVLVEQFIDEFLHAHTDVNTVHEEDISPAHTRE